MPKISLLQQKGNALETPRLTQLYDDIRRSAHLGAQIILLPELFLHPYFPQTEDPVHFKLAHNLETPEILQLRALAQELKVVIVTPFFEKRAPGVYHNSVTVIDANGDLLGTYRKMHIPDDPGFYEKYYFTPGDLGYKCFESQYGKIGVLICWDQWFPEAARLTALKGCDLLVYPTAIGWDKKELAPLIDSQKLLLKEKQLNAWKIIQQSHAIANGVYLAAINRVGIEKDIIFWGNSFLCDPLGEITHLGSENKEEFIVGECDWKEIERTRQTWPFFRDRRIDSYDNLKQRLDD